jgi:hypothetical protein
LHLEERGVHLVDFFVLAILNSNMRLECATILRVLVSSQTVAHCVVPNISNVPVAFLFLDKVVLASHVDREVLENLGRETGSLNSFELEGLNELVLRSETFTSNMDHTYVDTADELSNNQMVNCETSVICVVVVEAVVLWLQIVSSVKELADVGATGPFDDEFTPGMIRSVVGSINDKVINKQQVTSTLTSDRVKLFLSHSGGRPGKVNVGAEENLVADLHNYPRQRKNWNTSNPKVWQLIS